jgi:hypothetical protein
MTGVELFSHLIEADLSITSVVCGLLVLVREWINVLDREVASGFSYFFSSGPRQPPRVGDDRC